MPANMTNSVVGALIEQVEHSCKYSDKGCQVKMRLTDLVTHEKQCPERTIQCPYHGCAQLVKLKNFDNHAIWTVDHYISNVILGRGYGVFGYKTLKVHVDLGRPLYWHIRCIQALDELFHVNLTYHKPSRSFVLTIWSQNIASKYTANLVIEGDKKKLCFDGIKVISVENVPSIETCIKETGKISLCLSRDLAKNISLKKQGEVGTWLPIKESLNVDISFQENLNVDAGPLEK